MHGKLLLVSLKEKYSDILFVLIVGNDKNDTPSVREETRDDGGRALPLRLVAMTALVIPFRVDNIAIGRGVEMGLGFCSSKFWRGLRYIFTRDKLGLVVCINIS